MIIILLAAIYVLGAAVLNRYRGNGGAWGPDWPHTVKRVIVSWWLALVFVPVVDPVGWGLGALILLIWLIGYMPGWGAYFDFKNQPEPEVWWIDRVLRRLSLGPVPNDITGMSLRGLHFTVPVSVFLALVHGNVTVLWLSAAGLLMGPVYYGMLLLYNAQERIRFDRIAWAEYTWGAVLATIYGGMQAVL